MGVAVVLAGGTGIVHAQQTNLSCSLTSVSFINGNTPSFTVTQSTSSSGTSTWLFPARVIDADTTNFATGTIGLTGLVNIRVTDAVNTYAAGNFAGFVLASSLINQNALGSLEVRTYLNGIMQESVVGSNLTVASSSIAGAYDVGYYTNNSFNAVELRISNALGTGSYFVYRAILRGTGSCSSPVLACNTNTRPMFPGYGVVLNTARTVVTGFASSSLTNTTAVVDNDPATYASLTTTTSVPGSAAVAAKDVTTNYVAGTFAGFDLENAVLLAPAQLGNLTINLYRDGVLKQSRSGTGLLLSATIQATPGRQVVGFVADSAFDEIQAVITQSSQTSLGTTRIYAPVVKRLCAGSSIPNNTRIRLVEDGTTVAVPVANSGFTGAACAACSLTGLGNLLDADTTNAAMLTLSAGASTSGQLAVRDAVTDYPVRTFAGFDLENTLLIDPALLANVSLGFYRDDVLRQTVSGSSLQVSAAGSGTPGRMMLGYVADSSFDQVKLILNQTGGANLGTTKVYGLFLERSATSLPLHLLSFHGTARACDAILEWEAYDDAGGYFDIEASANGRNFEPVARVQGKSKNANSRHAWAQVQRTPVAYYRLRSTDAAGKVVYSNVMLVQTNCNNMAVTARPNPTSGMLTLNNLPERATVEIYNMLGISVLHAAATARTQAFDLRTVPAGQYQLVIRSTAGAATYIRIAVQH